MRFLMSLLTVLLVFDFFTVFAQPQKVDVSGNIKGNYTGRIYLFFDDNYKQRDSSEVINGTFHFTANVILPVRARVHVGGWSVIHDFYLDGQSAFLDCFNRMVPDSSGGETHNYFRIDSIRGGKLQVNINKFLRENNVSVVEDIYKLKDTGYYRALANFVHDNPNSKIALYLLSIHFLTV